MSKKMVAVFTLCLFIALAGLSAAESKPMPKPANKDAIKKMEKAEKAIKNKEFDKAQALLQEIIQLEPTYAPAYYFNGAIHRMKKENDQALAMLEKAVQLQPDLTLAINEYAFLLSSLAHDMNAQNQPAKAVDYYARIVVLPGLENTQKPLLIESCFNMGISAFQAQTYEKSNEAFNRLLAIPGIETDSKQNYALAQYLMGLNFSFLNKPEDSNLHLLKFLELAPTAPADQYVPLAAYLVGKNEYSQLTEEISKVKNDPAAASDLRVRVQNLAKSHIRIQEMLLKTLAIKTDIEDAYVVLGNYYYLARDLDQAIATYKVLIEKNPASPTLADYQNFLKNLENEKNPPPPPAKPKGKKK